MDLAAELLERNLGMLGAALADFSDADLLMRPCPNANHASWQLGHLIVAETNIINGFRPGAAAPLPEGFDKKFKKDTAGNDDPAFFPRKNELLGQFAKTRAGTVAFVKSLKESDLDQPAPERFRGFIPTLGAALFMVPNHATLHLGQMQVLRRRLGKPVLF
jgi:uncharacterized damage-inducible protein DinB